MVNEDEKQFQAMNEKDSNQADLVQNMKEHAERKAYTTKCMLFCEKIKQLRKEYQNDMEFGAAVSRLIKGL